MHAYTMNRGRFALALGAALVLVGCGEVTGPADSPPPPPPEEEADLGAMTDEDFGGDEAPDEGSGSAADETMPDSGAGNEESAYAGIGKPTEGDTRTLEVIANLVRQNRQPVRACYETARKKQPELQGSMVISFEVDPEGKVTKAELNEPRSQIKDPELAACAIKVIKGIKFPASSKGMVTDVNYPYKFKP